MLNKMTKADFLLKIKSMESPSIKTERSSVYLYDYKNQEKRIEVYRASTMQEPGVISAMNQAGKFRKWILQAKNKGA